jgi:putative ABC transport system ATP-binding protein
VVVELLATLNREFRRTVVIATHSTMADPYATVQLYLRDGRIVDRACESASS